MSSPEKKLTTNDPKADISGAEDLPPDKRADEEIGVSELGLRDLYRGVSYTAEGTEQRRLFKEIEEQKSGLEKIAGFFKEKFGVLVAKKEIAAVRERGAELKAAGAEKSKEYGAKLSEYLGKKIAKVDKEAASIENKTGRNIYRCWKVLGDINLSDIKSEEWKKEHALGAAVLRFFSLRTALAAGMVGASVIGGAAGGAIEFSRRAMRGVGTAVLAHDFVKMREEQKLARILEEINTQPKKASAKERAALAKKVIAASVLLERKRGATFSPEEQSNAKERLAALREKVGIDDARMSSELRKSKFRFATTVAGAGAVGFFAGDLWKKLVGAAGVGADSNTYTGINPEYPTHPTGTVTEHAQPPVGDVRIADITVQKEPSFAVRTEVERPAEEVIEYAKPAGEAYTLSSEPKGFEKGLAAGIDVHEYARIKGAWLDRVKDVIDRAENVPAEEAHAGVTMRPLRLTPREYMDLERLASIDPGGKTELGKLVAHAQSLVEPKLEAMGIHSETFDGKKTVYQTLREMYAKDNNAFGGRKAGQVFLQWLEYSGSWSSDKGPAALASLRDHLTMPKGTALLYANNASEGIEIRENIQTLKETIARSTAPAPTEQMAAPAETAEPTRAPKASKIPKAVHEETHRPRKVSRPRIHIVEPVQPTGQDINAPVSPIPEVTQATEDASASAVSPATESIPAEQTPNPDARESEAPRAPEPEATHSHEPEQAPEKGGTLPENAQPGKFTFSLENFYGNTTPATMDFHYNEKGIPASFAFDAHFMGTELDDAARKMVQGKTTYLLEFSSLAKIPYSKIALGEDTMTTSTKMLLVYERVHQMLLDSGKTAEANVVLRASMNSVRRIARTFGREILQWEHVPQFVRSGMAYDKLPTMREVLNSKYHADVPPRDVSELLHDK